jgi:hypothetical protein
MSAFISRIHRNLMEKRAAWGGEKVNCQNYRGFFILKILLLFLLVSCA